MELPKIIISRFELYPAIKPHSYCVGFSCSNRYIDTLIPRELNKTEDYYIEQAMVKLQDSLQKICIYNANPILGREVILK